MAITLTESAAKHVAGYLSKRGKGIGVRLGVRTTGCSGLAYKLEYADAAAPEDHHFQSRGISVIVDPKSLPYIDGTELDFAREGLNEGFKFNNPNVKDECGCGDQQLIVARNRPCVDRRDDRGSIGADERANQRDKGEDLEAAKPLGQAAIARAQRQRIMDEQPSRSPHLERRLVFVEHPSLAERASSRREPVDRDERSGICYLELLHLPVPRAALPASL